MIRVVYLCIDGHGIFEIENQSISRNLLSLLHRSRIGSGHVQHAATRMVAGNKSGNTPREETREWRHFSMTG